MRSRTYNLSYAVAPSGKVFSTSSSVGSPPLDDCPVLVGLYKTLEAADRVKESVFVNGVMWVSEIEVIE